MTRVVEEVFDDLEGSLRTEEGVLEATARRFFSFLLFSTKRVASFSDVRESRSRPERGERDAISLRSSAMAFKRSRAVRGLFGGRTDFCGTGARLFVVNLSMTLLRFCPLDSSNL